MSTLSALGTGAARAAGTVFAAGLLVTGGTGAAQQAVAAGGPEAPTLDPVKAKPGAGPHGLTLRLPDGRILHFTFVPPPWAVGAGPRHPKAGASSSDQPGAGTPSGSPPGTPSPQPSGDPSTSGLPVPVISPLFPSPELSGSHPAESPPSRDPAGPQYPSSSAPAAADGNAPTQDGSGMDAAVPDPAQPERPASSVPVPASTVPPPLGPQALLRPDVRTERLAVPHDSSAGGLGRRVRLLGVGLALIGTGAALFGWRIRRL